jgi:hypothetical protein
MAAVRMSVSKRHSREEGEADGWTMISYIQFSRRALGVFQLRGHGTLSGAVLVVNEL